MTMLTVAEARAKARTRLRSSMSTWATQDGPTGLRRDEGPTDARRDEGPEVDAVGPAVLEIALHPPTERQVLNDQHAAAEWAANWRAIAAPGAGGSKSENSNSPSIDWTERSWARVGRQQIPLRLRLPTPDSVAGFVGGDEERRWLRLKDRTAAIRSRFADQDGLSSAIKAHATRILGLGQSEFDTILDVVAWLRNNPLGTLRPRQLPIRGVDSKWFEAHRTLVTALLAASGRPEAVAVLDAEPRVRMRILDPELTPSGLSDISAPVAQLSELPIEPGLVFVFENLESMLAMPTWPDAVAVHGSGYAVDNVARLAWVHRTRVIYWGDLDSHGFAILSRLRRHLPETQSVLMDEATLIAHRDLWVPEPKPHPGMFSDLTGIETRALARLRAEDDVRLEQERIPWDTAMESLRAAASEPAAATGRDDDLHH
ncbi:MAG: DUF2220 family protein [Brevibacterium sp.]|nr:DUF2220 family protein [Brevibacterium sp.]